jgi:hypothetical protein
MSNIMKISLVRVELLHADRRRGRNECNSRISQFCESAKKFHVHLQLQSEAGGATVRHSYFPKVIQEITLPFKNVLHRFSATARRYKFNSKVGLVLESDQNVFVLFVWL